MTGPIDTLVAQHLDAWNAPAGAERDRLIAATYAAGVSVGEPGAAYRGHDGMAEAISQLQAQAPGAGLTRSGPVQVAQDLVTYGWSLGAPGQPALASGRDILLIEDHTIVSLYVVIDAS